MSPEKRFASIVEEFRGKAGITLPSSGSDRKKGFGSSGLKFKDKVFAMLASEGRFVAKLPRERVDELVAKGDGERFDPRRNGHVMKEWVVMKPNSKIVWLEVAREASAFAGRRPLRV